jgi:hypothetical protein
MIKVSAKISQNQITPVIQRQIAALAALPAQGEKEFQALTPIDTGNARRRTRLQRKEIVADYPYAQRLDDNWSKQTHGQGIVAPFTKWWIAQLKRIARIK